jgi:polyisoprenoid-binding protein YceI
MNLRPRHALAALGTALALAACGTATPPAPGAGPAAPAPLARAAADAVPFAIDAEASRLRFIVRRAGTLARLGHNHVILARRIDGQILRAPDITRSTVSLRLPVAHFEVDPPAERAALGVGFEPLPAQAVLATRRNLLGPRVLDATRHPEVRIDTVAVAGPAAAPRLTLRIALRGVARDITVPVRLLQAGPALQVEADFELRQSDFDIAPLSVLGGALQVADPVTVQVRLVARPGP